MQAGPATHVTTTTVTLAGAGAAAAPRPVPVALIGGMPADGATAPRAAVFYPAADMLGGTLCLAEGAGGEAALAAAALPFVIPEKYAPDVGDQPEAGFAVMAPAIAQANPYFRRVLFTAPDGVGQLTAMSLQPLQSVGLEAHPQAAQVIMIEAGAGRVRVGNQLYHVGPGALIVVPTSVLHDIANTSETEPLSLLVFYTSALHEPGLVEPLKGSADLAAAAARSQCPMRDEAAAAAVADTTAAIQQAAIQQAALAATLSRARASLRNPF
jgi:mannose-6-phosphate isomerase-like protein (cupin superfamily)